MSAGLSRWLVILESLVLVAPVTAFALFITLALLVDLVSGTPVSLFFLLLLFLALAALAAGWRLIVAFVRRGARGLSAVSKPWLVVATLGCALVIVATLSSLLDFWFESHSVRKTELGFLAYGIPAAVPYVHLLLERFRRVGS